MSGMIAQNPGPPPQPKAEAQPIKVDVQWACKVLAMDAKGQPAGEIKEPPTVGDHFLLVCEGPPLQLQKDKVTLEVPKESKYFLRLLSTRELSESRGEFIATSWTAGELKITNPVLTDGEKRIGLGPYQVTFSSVIDPKANPEGKLYPPWGPVFLSWPLWVWLSFTLVFAVLALLVTLRIRRMLKKKRLMKILHDHPIATKPYFQFTKELRRLSRELPIQESDWNDEKAKIYFNDLNLSLRWYLARELWVPAFDGSAGEILRDLKRQDENLHRLVHRDLIIAFNELNKASGQKKVKIVDAQQILELSRQVADRIHKSREA